MVDMGSPPRQSGGPALLQRLFQQRPLDFAQGLVQVALLREEQCGVARQYSGPLGKVGNCQIGVSLHYATNQGGMPLDFELYLPEAWINAPERCRKAGVPQNTAFQTK